MLIRRDRYLRKLIDRMGNGQIKVVTGVRRCGKSFLVFNLFREYLREQGVPDGNVIEVALDDDDNEALRDVGNLSKHIKERLATAQGCATCSSTRSSSPSPAKRCATPTSRCASTGSSTACCAGATSTSS